MDFGNDVCISYLSSCHDKMLDEIDLKKKGFILTQG